MDTYSEAAVVLKVYNFGTPTPYDPNHLERGMRTFGSVSAFIEPL